ncbi:unnamed protein product [Prorocentrum cordatum]|uniref:Uncharacterized protein n=1 Tax=Prorocentrum cordatum TaxID=2364126 RepID=A0ABN9RER0_9DINO|nr:unnamed protein product [Polarella glacialis]
MGGLVGLSKYTRPLCMQAAPDRKSMQMHFGSKHPKATFDIVKCQDLYAGVKSSTAGVALRGGIRKHHNGAEVARLGLALPRSVAPRPVQAEPTGWQFCTAPIP